MTTTVGQPARHPRRLQLRGRTGLPIWGVVVIFVLGLTIAKGGQFWNDGYIAAVLSAAVVIGLASLGQHVVIISGGIDLSVGSMATLAALLTAILMGGHSGRTWPVLIVVALLGAVVGLIHGALVYWGGVAPLVVTLATFYLLQGVAFFISTTPTGQVSEGLASFGINSWGPIPQFFTVLVVAAIVLAVLLRRIPWGRHLYAVGGDPSAARSVGVPVGRTILGAYAASGLLAAIAGIMLASQATIGDPTAGQGLELSAITVVVVGGVSLGGGRGSLAGTVGGIALLALLPSSFTLLQVPATYSDLIRGIVIIAAVTIFVAKSKRRGVR